MAPRDCTDVIRNAAGGELSDDEILEIAERIARRRARMVAEGRLDGIDRELARFAGQEAERARIAAAVARKHAAINAVVRDRIDAQIRSHMASGLSPRQAVLAILEGTARDVPEGRSSVMATRQAFESRWIGGIEYEIERDVPHLWKMLTDKKLNDDTVREMGELRAGGQPGITKNPDAQKLASIFARYGEMARSDLNRLGAVIGKLEGWTGPQSHDPYRLLKVSPEAWVQAILPRLDLERTFGDVVGDDGLPDLKRIREILRSSYTSIVTGRDHAPSAKEKGEFLGPANLARSLSRHRVFHFRSADDWIAYNEQFGFGNLFSAMHAYLNRSARTAAQMLVLGPNPETMLGSVMEALARRVNDDPNIPEKKKARWSKALTGDVGTTIRAAISEMSGATLAPANGTVARLGSGARSIASMAKLGAALLSTFGDPVILAANMRYQGMPVLQAYAEMAMRFIHGRGEKHVRERAFLLGEGCEAWINRVISAYDAGDGVPGRMHQLTMSFFRWSGLAAQADITRSVAAQMASSWLARHAPKTLAELPKGLARVLSVHGIDEARWDVLRAHAVIDVEGKMHLAPENVDRVPDDAMATLITAEIDAARKQASLRGRPAGSAPSSRLTLAQQTWFEGWLSRRLADERLNLEIALRAMVSDEVSFGHVETDEASRRLTLFGTRPGSVEGETFRFLMQFKGFPIGFTRRPLARAFRGGKGGHGTAGVMHIGHLIAGLAVAGYIAGMAKDLAKGYLPAMPETPWQWWKLFLRSMAQSGGLGIYGDFLFGEANRFGGGALETAAGPVIGEAATVIDIVRRAKEGDMKAADLFNLALRNTPFMNLFYVRPALDYLVLSAIHEMLSPGYYERQTRRREEDYGQERAWEPVLP